ncbi:MAG: hypothetical protein IKJ91_07850, partial [Clostridia bacterium]|nr:hypothetical protein [Clostridia bacterium]
ADGAFAADQRECVILHAEGVGADHANAVVGIKPTSITKHIRRLSIRFFILLVTKFAISFLLFFYV